MKPSPAVETLRWEGDRDGCLLLIDQTRLPEELREVRCLDLTSVWQAIRTLQVRGAPAIGVAAAYGVVLGMQSAGGTDAEVNRAQLDRVVQYLASSRPTAVNLFWALERLQQVARQMDLFHDPPALRDALLQEARRLHDEDREICHAIGRHGAALFADVQTVLTHCNAGGLATSEYGTALSVLFTLQDMGRSVSVYVDETRPLLQGARLTAWELVRRGIPATLICDSMAAQVMKEGRIQAVITGADRIAANGDSANKIGTYSLAVLAQAHAIPFYIAAPKSTFDLSLDCGAQIPIEQRDGREITHGFGRPTAPDGVQVYNPAFDVTPARLITALITESGVVRPVTTEHIARVLAR